MKSNVAIMKTNVAIGKALERLGVEYVFGLMGEGNMRFVTQFGVSSGLSYIQTRHEATGVAMADGYARLSNRLGVSSITEGPGLANCLLALRAAVIARSPILVIAGAPPVGAQGHIQEIDQSGVFEVAGARAFEVTSSETIMSDIYAAARVAVDERIPVGISIPVDLQLGESEDVEPDFVAEVTVERVEPDPAGVDEVIAGIRAADRPLVLAGRGAVWSGAGPALAELGERLGAPLATSLQAKDTFNGHPQSLGICGGFSSEAVADLIRGADLILAFGAGLNEWTSRGGSIFSERAEIIKVDCVAENLNRYIRPHLGLVGDADLAAKAIIEKLPERIESAWDLAEIEATPKIDPYEDASDEIGMDPRSLMDRLDEMLPRERLVGHDGGHHLGYVAKHLQVRDAPHYLYGAFFGAVGLGLGTSFGAAFADRDTFFVTVIGDGGVMMTLGELETAVRLELPLLIVVVNDGAFAAELHHLNLIDMPSEQSVFGNADVAAVARALGAQGLTASKVEDLDALRGWLESRDGPMVVDCKVTRSVWDRWMEDVASMHGALDD